MLTKNRETTPIGWVLLIVLLALIVSALAGLQLFQDGSSYLLEILLDHSAVRHGRLSILLFQSPTIFLVKLFQRFEIDPLFTLPLVRFAFNLNYALSSFVALLLSWLVVRKRREELLIWPVLIILIVNLVNFSWVSELLISVQLSCPLLLALLHNPKGKTFWTLFVFLTPFLFFLHPLVTTIYFVLAAASAYIAYRRPDDRRVATLSMILFLLVGVTRGLYSLFTLSPYEMSMAASGEINEYFVVDRLENLLFLGAALEVAALILWATSLSRSRWRVMKALPWFVTLQAYALILFAAHFLLGGNLFPLVLVGCLGIPAFLPFRQPQGGLPMATTRLLYLACAFLAISASSLLLAQYASDEKQFTLKMGLDLFIALSMMAMAALDSVREVTPQERILRFRLVFGLSLLFACVITVKSLLWHTAVNRLEHALGQTQDMCVEITAADFQWLSRSPYTIINNWALTSLALVIQDDRPRKALLAQGDCQVFYESGLIQIDPWNRFSKKFLVPTLE